MRIWPWCIWAYINTVKEVCVCVCVCVCLCVFVCLCMCVCVSVEVNTRRATGRPAPEVLLLSTASHWPACAQTRWVRSLKPELDRVPFQLYESRTGFNYHYLLRIGFGTMLSSKTLRFKKKHYLHLF